MDGTIVGNVFVGLCVTILFGFLVIVICVVLYSLAAMVAGMIQDIKSGEWTK